MRRILQLLQDILYNFRMTLNPLILSRIYWECALVSLTKKKKEKKKSKISFLKYIHIGTDKFNKTKSSFDEGRNTRRVRCLRPILQWEVSSATKLLTNYLIEQSEWCPQTPNIQGLPSWKIKAPENPMWNVSMPLGRRATDWGSGVEDSFTSVPFPFGITYICPPFEN